MHARGASAQSLLDAWRAELARKPLSMSEADACAVLGITPAADGTVPEDDLKTAYRRYAAYCTAWYWVLHALHQWHCWFC